MHRQQAVNHALDILKLRIANGAHANSKADEIIKELTALVEGFEKINLDDPGARAQHDFSRPPTG